MGSGGLIIDRFGPLVEGLSPLCLAEIAMGGGKSQ